MEKFFCSLQENYDQYLLLLNAAVKLDKMAKKKALKKEKQKFQFLASYATFNVIYLLDRALMFHAH